MYFMTFRAAFSQLIVFDPELSSPSPKSQSQDQKDLGWH